MAEVLRGAPVAAAITEDLRARVEALAGKGVTPTLAVVRLGERADDLSYERAIMKRSAKVGFAVRSFVLPLATVQADLERLITSINDDPAIHGCLLLRPLPAHLDDVAAQILSPEKDVDGITPASGYAVFAGASGGFAPCTAEAVVALLEGSGVALSGARVTVVGRSLVIGRPVACLLMQRDATVTVCHTKTRDLARECSRADIVVVAAGRRRTIDASCVRSGQVVIDVGVNEDKATGGLVGDVEFDEVEPIVSAITPVPGGVGAVTTAVLARHVVAAAEQAVVRS